MITKPLYIFNGLLDSGKTSVIKETLLDPGFTVDERTLIIAFEEGDEEYDKAFLDDTNSFVIYLDKLQDLTIEKMRDLERTYTYDRIIMECNGLQNEAEYLKNYGLINNWEIAQILTVVDASSFRMQLINLKQFIYDHIKISEVAIFNRFRNDEDYLFIRNNLKAINPKVELIFEDIDHNIVEFEGDDIFDLSKDPIVINDNDYGLWYMDAANTPEKYENKHLVINVKLIEDLKEYDKACIMGRRAMVCCSEDIADIGITVVGIDKTKIQKDTYYKLDGIIHLVDAEDGYKTCLLYVDNVSKGETPKEELVTFN